MATKVQVTPPFDITKFQYKQNYALEASAGTGKTYSIKQIVKRLVYDFGVGLDKLLIVTYTEKAAGELKDRIRDALTSPKEGFGGKPIIELVGDRVNCDVDNASIGTIHSFCKNTIKEFSISSNQPINLDLAGDDLISQYVQRYIREGDILKDITAMYALGTEVNIEDLTKGFTAVLKKYYLDSNYEEVENIINYKKHYDDLVTLEMVFSKDPIAILKEKKPNIYNSYLILKQYADADQTIEKLVKSFEDYPTFFSSAPSRKDLGISKSNLPPHILAAVDDLYTLEKPSTKAEFNYYLIDKYLIDLYKSFQEYKEENRLQSFNDMLRMVREAVLSDNSELLKRLKEKYSYGIIDEFQDTNQIQFDIFTKVFMDDEDHNIIVVGDPKQSIYSFQGADVKVYERAVKYIVDHKGLKRRLEKNHRSAPGVVEFGNELFTGYFDNFEASKYCTVNEDNKELRLKYKGQYSSSLWLNENVLGDHNFAKFAAIQIIDCTEINDNGETNLRLGRYNKDSKEFEYRNVTFSDFVVLARTKSEMYYIQNALRQANVPCIRYKDDSLFTRIECAHWIALLEAIDVVDFTGNNRGYFKKALYTRFFDYPLSEISKPKYDEDNIQETNMFSKWRHKASLELWEDLFDEIISDTDLEIRLSSLTDSQSLGAFKQIAEYAIDYLSNNHTIKDLIKELGDLSKKSSSTDNEDSSLVAKTTDFHSVTVMTMHASKGLQFPVVISVGGLVGLKKEPDCFVLHEELENGDTKCFVCLEDDENETAKHEQIEEFVRLFYVAFTRPEYLLIAPRYSVEKDLLPEISSLMEDFIERCRNQTFEMDGLKINLYETKAFQTITYKDLRTRAKKTLSKITEEERNVDDGDPDEQENRRHTLIVENPKRHAYKHSYSTFAHPHNDEPEEILDGEFIIDKEGESVEQVIKYDETAKQINGDYDPSKPTLVIPDGYPKGAGMGNAIHEVFERLDFTNFGAYIEQLIIDRYSSQGFNLEGEDKKPWRDYTKAMVENVLSADLPVVKGNHATGEKFKLCEILNKDKKAEAEFNFNYPNEKLRNYLNGFIDLMFKRGDVYSILDWKSDTLNDDFSSYADAEQLKNHVDERYSIQRVLYCYCLIKWLKTYYGGTEEEIFNNHFGGIYYVFVRGCNKDSSNGVYIQTWEGWEDLKTEYNKIINSDKGGSN